MNILRFEMNVPKQVALEAAQGTRVEGRYGDRVMYKLFGGRVMYVPPIIAAKIEADGITAGEPFELCKTQIANGPRRAIEWRLRRIESDEGQQQESAASEPDSGQPPSETQLEADLRASLQLVRQPQNGGAVPVATCDPSTRGEVHPEPVKQATGAVASEEQAQEAPVKPPRVNGNGGGRVYESLDEDPNNAGPTTKLEHALKTAISAAHNAEKYGTELGYVVRFDADAIKSMAITVLINMTQGARR